MGLGKAVAKAANRRRRENDVTDLAESDQQNLQKNLKLELPNYPITQLPNYPITRLPNVLRLDGGFIDQHDRDVVLNRVDAVTGRAFEGRAVLDEVYRRFAVGTGENLEQFRVNGHGRTI
jgi:hypothetical protein